MRLEHPPRTPVARTQTETPGDDVRMSKHLKTDTPSDADLKGNPGIGQSKGLTGTDPEAIEGDSTFEGDVENETTPEGGVDPNHRGRTNA